MQVDVQGKMEFQLLNFSEMLVTADGAAAACTRDFPLTLALHLLLPAKDLERRENPVLLLRCIQEATKPGLRGPVSRLRK